MPRPSPSIERGRPHLRHAGLLAALLTATALFRMTQNMAVTTLSLLARDDVHLSATEIGALGALMGLMVALVTLFVSRRVPHQQAAVSAAAGMIGLAVSLLVLAAASSFAVLLAGVLLLGIAGGIAMPGLLNAVVSIRAGERERVIAVYTVTLSVSLAVGPLVETLLLSSAGQEVRIPYLAFAALPVVGAGLILAATWRRRSEGGRAGAAREEEGELAVDAAGDIASDPPHPAPASAGRRRGGLLSSQSGRIALVSQLLYAVPFAGITVFGALVARVGYGASPARAQLGFTVFFVFSLASRAVVAWRAPIGRKVGLLWASAALTAAGLLLLGVGEGQLAYLAAMAMLGVPHGLTFPIALALVAESTAVTDLPRANATLLGSTNLTSVIVPLVLGAVIPAVGYRGMTLVMLGPVAAFALVQFGLRSGPRRAA
ncbi:MAG TPA: MFS transporter [Acidimicrobiales bacterium]|nr:MFS transporter [Acidimicrobiales bacterium]